MSKAFDDFTSEIDQLKKFYVGTIHAYHEAFQEARREVNEGHCFENTAIVTDVTAFPNVKVADNFGEWQSKTKNSFPSQLAELVLVRLVSILESYLISNLRELFSVRTDLFDKSENFSIPYSQMLSFGSISQILTLVINKECRALQNSGFEKIIQYYRKNSAVDFSPQGQNLKIISEMHDRRHLLVHRLGYVDEKYRKDYKFNEKRIRISKRYLANCFDAVTDFSSFLCAETKELRKGRNIFRHQGARPCVAFVELDYLNKEGEKVTKRNYIFLGAEKIMMVGDILFSKQKLTKKSRKIGLEGSIEQVESYIDYLKTCEAKGRIRINKIQFVKKNRPREEYIDRVYEEIRAFLLAQSRPWNVVDLCNPVAEMCNITPSQARRVIWLIIRNTAEAGISEKNLNSVSEKLETKGEFPSVHTEIAHELGESNGVVYAAIRKIRQTNLFAQDFEEVKEFADSTPVLVEDSLTREDAAKMKEKLEAAGASIEIK